MIHFSLLGQQAGIERPIGLVIALALLAFAALQAVLTLRRRGVVRPWVTPGREAQLASGHSPVARAVRVGLFGIGAALLAIAWSGPLYGEAEQRISRRGIDLVIALDASRSMLAADVAPSRLTAARVAIEELLGQLGGDRVGIVAFARDAFVQAPLTTDYDAARLYLRAIDPLQMQQGGTALSRALGEAEAMFRRAEHGDRDRAVLLVSDGEDWSKGAADQARLLAAQGVIVYTLGVGSTAGAPVPVLDQRGQLIGYEKDARGEPVVTRPNPGALAELAAAGNGEAFFAPGAVSAAAVAERIQRLQKGELGTRVRRASVDRYQWFALPGALFLALALALGEQRRARAIKVAAALAAIALAPSARAQGLLHSPDPRVREGIAAYDKGDYPAAEQAFAEAEAKGRSKPTAAFNRGVALFKAGKAEQSIEAFGRADAPELQGRDAYNRGVALAALEKKDEAIKAFRSALERDPMNEDARHNLEVLLAKKKEEERREKQASDPKQREPEEKDGKPPGEQRGDGKQQDQAGEKQEQRADGKQEQQPSDKPDQAGEQQEQRAEGEQEQQASDQPDQAGEKQEQGADGTQEQRSSQQQDQAGETADEKQGLRAGQGQPAGGKAEQQSSEKQQALRADGRTGPPTADHTPVKPRSEAERVLDQLKRGERLLPVGRPTHPSQEDVDDEHPW